MRTVLYPLSLNSDIRIAYNVLLKNKKLRQIRFVSRNALDNEGKY